MHGRYCLPVCRNVLHVPTKTLTSSSLALFVAPAEPPLSITSRGRPHLFSSSSFSIFSLFVTGKRYCWSSHLSALLLLFSKSPQNGCGETTDPPLSTSISRGFLAQLLITVCLPVPFSCLRSAGTRRIHVPHHGYSAPLQALWCLLMLKPVKVSPKASVI